MQCSAGGLFPRSGGFLLRRDLSGGNAGLGYVMLSVPGAVADVVGKEDKNEQQVYSGHEQAIPRVR